MLTFCTDILVLAVREGFSPPSEVSNYLVDRVWGWLNFTPLATSFTSTPFLGHLRLNQNTVFSQYCGSSTIPTSSHFLWTQKSIFAQMTAAGQHFSKGGEGGRYVFSLCSFIWTPKMRREGRKLLLPLEYSGLNCTACLILTSGKILLHYFAPLFII